MNPKDWLLPTVQRVLSTTSDPQKSNVTLISLIQSLATEFGLKTKVQKISHSMDGVSPDLSNIVVFSGDELVDRSTKKGLLFVNPLDAVVGTEIPEQKFWQEGNGASKRYIAPGALQGKADFVCRMIAMAEVLSGRRHKNPVYVAGVSGGSLGGLGSRFFAESFQVNPKWVIGYAPLGPKWAGGAMAEIGLKLNLSFPARPKDTKGYSRRIDIKVLGQSTTWADHSESMRGVDLLFAMLLEGSSQGFDFQWSKLDVLGPSGCPSDFIASTVFVSTFQYEDFKDFILKWIDNQQAASCFKVDFVGEAQSATDFLLPELVEAILEVDLQIQDLLDANSGELIGGINSIVHRAGKLEIDLAFQAYDLPLLQECESRIREFFKKMNAKNKLLATQIQRKHLLPPVVAGASQGLDSFTFLPEGENFTQRVRYMSDLGIYTAKGAAGLLTGMCNEDSRILAVDEHITEGQILEMYEFYENVIRRASE